MKRVNPLEMKKIPFFFFIDFNVKTNRVNEIIDL